MLGTGMGTFWKSQILIPSKKNQSVLIAKIRSRKTHKIANPKNKLPQTFRAIRKFRVHKILNEVIRDISPSIKISRFLVFSKLRV